MKTIEFTIPGIPVQKKSAYHRPSKDGKFVITQKHKDNDSFEDRIIAHLKASGQWDFNNAPHAGPVGMCVRAYFPLLKSWSKKKQREMTGQFHIKKPDLDRIENMIQDALTGIIYVDDCQVCERPEIPFKCYAQIPRTEVKIYLYDEPLAIKLNEWRMI